MKKWFYFWHSYQLICFEILSTFFLSTGSLFASGFCRCLSFVLLLCSFKFGFVIFCFSCDFFFPCLFLFALVRKLVDSGGQPLLLGCVQHVVQFAVHFVGIAQESICQEDRHIRMHFLLECKHGHHEVNVQNNVNHGAPQHYDFCEFTSLFLEVHEIDHKIQPIQQVA